jgi:hypothetical protein
LSANKTLDEQYFLWLIDLIKQDNNSPHIILFEQLYKKPFEWYIPNDDNRAEDGRLLRDDFLSETGVFADENWMELDCSILELIIALANRLSFETDIDPTIWFWELLNNLGLSEYANLDRIRSSIKEINSILSTLNKREYEEDGYGGLFPLRNPGKDQRKVEIWYQMSAYLLENDFTY